MEKRIQYGLEYIESLGNSDNQDLIYNFYYLSSTRSLFPPKKKKNPFTDEPAMAPILASEEFLNVPDKVNDIANFFENFPIDWTDKISFPESKKALLEQLGLDKWPEKAGLRWYSDEAEKQFQKADIQLERSIDFLKNYPNSMHLFMHIFLLLIKQYPRAKKTYEAGRILTQVAFILGKAIKLLPQRTLYTNGMPNMEKLY